MRVRTPHDDSESKEAVDGVSDIIKRPIFYILILRNRMKLFTVNRTQTLAFGNHCLSR